MRRLSQGATALLLLGCSLTLSSCGVKSVILRESEQVFFLDRGDSVPRDDMVCMDKGTALRLFQQEADGILNE